jgi:XTP/dITP diphosphohydrolase
MSDDIWVLASNNRHKLEELASPLSVLGKKLKPQSDWQVEDADETGLSFIENAILKARHAAHLTEKPAIADDSGLMVSALSGAPGIYSARYAGEHGNDAANRQKLLAELAQVPSEDRVAAFICVLAAVRSADDSLPMVAIGQWRGEIAGAEMGENGFGYDSIFIPEGYQCTAAELLPADKQRISHRALAITALVAEFSAR